MKSDFVTVALAGRLLAGAGGAAPDGDGTTWTLTSLTGWSDGVTTRGKVNDWPFHDGGWAEPAFLSSRTIIVGCAVEAPATDIVRVYDAFKAALPIRAFQPIVVTEAGRSRWAMVRVDGQPTVKWRGRDIAVITVQLIASDPRLFTGAGPDDVSGSAVARLPITVGGLQIPGPQVTDTNWATNPSFEVDTSGWAGVGGQLTRETASPPSWVSGTAWGRLTTSAGSTRPGVLAASATDQRVDLAAGEWAAASVVLANQAGYTSQVGIRFFDASNTRISESMSAPANNNGVRVSMSAQAPAGTSYASLVPYMYNGGTTFPAGVVLDFDAAKLSKGATQADALARAADYFDGATAPSGGYTYRYTSTPGKSTSEKVRDAGLQAPFQILATVTGSKVIVGSDSTVTPHVVVTIAAVGEPLVNPQLTDELGNRMRLAMTLSPGQFVVLDFDERSILLNGTAPRQSSRRGQWIEARPGMELSFDAEGYTNTNQATATVAWTDANI